MQINPGWFLLLLAVGCGNHPHMGSVGGVDGGPAAGTLTVNIVSPHDTTYTNGTITVQVAVAGGNADRLDLVANGALLATLPLPYQYSWDTRGMPEASYTLVARATLGGATFDSSPLTVVVDRTPPTISDRFPAPGATNVDEMQPFWLQFSEAMNSVTLTDSSVTLSDGAKSLDKTLTLSSDATKLTLSNPNLSQAAETLSITLGDKLSDRAGNLLVMPKDAWTFTVPVWRQLGGELPLINGGASGKGSSLVLDGAGRPVIAYLEVPTLGGNTLHVRRYNGTSWEALGGSSDVVGTSGNTGAWALAVDHHGNPAVALSWSSVTLYRWDGAAWQSSNGPPVVGGPASVLSLAFDADDNPTVADQYGFPPKIDVERWVNGAWQSLPLAVHSGQQIFESPSIAIDPQGVLWMAYLQYISGQNYALGQPNLDDYWGNQWTVGSLGLNVATAPKVACGSGAGQRPYLGMTLEMVQVPNPNPIWMFQVWSPSGAISPAVQTSATGTIAVGPNGQLVSAWPSYASGNFVTTVNGYDSAKGAWSNIGTTLPLYADLALAVLSSGKTVVAGSQLIGTRQAVFTYLFNH